MSTDVRRLEERARASETALLYILQSDVAGVELADRMPTGLLSAIGVPLPRTHYTLRRLENMSSSSSEF